MTDLTVLFCLAHLLPICGQQLCAVVPIEAIQPQVETTALIDQILIKT